MNRCHLDTVLACFLKQTLSEAGQSRLGCRIGTAMRTALLGRHGRDIDDISMIFLQHPKQPVRQKQGNLQVCTDQDLYLFGSQFLMQTIMTNPAALTSTSMSAVFVISFTASHNFCSSNKSPSTG